MQAELVDFSLLKSYNDNYKYILVVVDVFPKKAFTAYLKSKSSSDMIEAFERVMPEIGKFSKLQTDMGREFLNRPFQTWLKQHHIDHFHTQNFDTKATIAERFIHAVAKTLALFYLHQQPKVRGSFACSCRFLQQHPSPIHRTCSEFSQCRKPRVGLAHALCRSRITKTETESRRPSPTVHVANAFSQTTYPDGPTNCFKLLECTETILLIIKSKIGWKELFTKKSYRKSIKRMTCFESSVFFNNASARKVLNS